MRWSIRLQLLLPLFILLLGVVGISTWTGIASAVGARQRIEKNMRKVAEHVRSTDYPLSKYLERMKLLSGADLMVVNPNDSDDRATTLPVFPADLPPKEYVFDDPEQLRLSPPLDVGKKPYLCSGIRLLPDISGNRRIVYILYPEESWRGQLWEAIEPSLVLGVFGGIASLVLGILVSRRLYRRIQALEWRTRLIASGDFSPMPLPRRNDELRDLTQSVNQMAEQLAKLQETVKQTERLRLLGQVGSGLAHQLRNGVTGARLAVQLHARACNGQADGEALDVALRQLDLVEANLKRFLDLGRTEALRREPCDLRKLIDDVVALLQPQCRHSHIELRWQPPEDEVSLQGDAVQLGHLLLNIVSNAVEAAGTGGWVEVGLRSSAGGNRPETNGRQSLAIIEVADSGPGPPPEIAARLFQPFVTGKREGVGLGLAVARQVAEAHGGRIDWSRQDDRTCFRIELPVPEPKTEQQPLETAS
jgi:signal transduction histidine kinase